MMTNKLRHPDTIDIARDGRRLLREYYQRVQVARDRLNGRSSTLKRTGLAGDADEHFTRAELLRSLRKCEAEYIAAAREWDVDVTA